MDRWLVWLTAFGCLVSSSLVEVHATETLPQVLESAPTKERYKLMVQPIALLGGAPNIEFSVPVSRKWTFDVGGFYVNMDTWVLGVSVVGLGARGTYHFSQDTTKDSWILSVGGDVYNAQARILWYSSSGVGLYPNLKFGYQWIGKHFVTRVGVGWSIITPGLDVGIGIAF